MGRERVKREKWWRGKDWGQEGAMQFKQESLANAKVSARQPCWSKTDFDVKLTLKVILCHSFCNQLQADKG